MGNVQGEEDASDAEPGRYAVAQMGASQFDESKRGDGEAAEEGDGVEHRGRDEIARLLEGILLHLICVGGTAVRHVGDLDRILTDGGYRLQCFSKLGLP